jgi:hypothetical protein
MSELLIRNTHNPTGLPEALRVSVEFAAISKAAEVTA